MKSIVLIIPYFGKWPVWFDAYLCSVASNPTISWLCPTDCEIPLNYPKNIRFLPITLHDLNVKVNKKVGVNVPLNPRKFCDLKPAYGDIFEDYIKEYDFWGFCDMDIIWGDIRKFMTPKILNEFDIISSRPNAISGHFNLFRNTSEINNYYKKINNYKELFSIPKFMWFDETVLTEKLILDATSSTVLFKIFWNKDEVSKGIESEVHQEYYLDRWLYKNGKIFDLYSDTNKEYMYLHFINWKRTMKYSDAKYSDTFDDFYISYSGIHFKKHTNLSVLINRVIIFFDGYHARLKRRNFKIKYFSLKKRFKNRFSFL